MLQGKPAGESEQVTMNAIRDILSVSEPTAPTRVMPKRRVAARTADVAATTRPVSEVAEKVRPARFTTIPSPQSEPVAIQARPSKGAVSSRTSNVPAPKDVARKLFRLPKLPKISNLDGAAKAPRSGAVARKPVQPKRLLHTGHIALLGLMVAAALNPSLAVAGVFLWFFVMIGLFLVVGPQRIWLSIGWCVTQYGTHNKEGADKVFDWLDTVAVRWDAVLDRFPDGMVETLYMPDFANIEALELEQQQDDRMSARLDRMHGQV